MIRYIIEFLLAFVLVFLFYKIVVLRKQNNFKKIPMELQLFITNNDLDIKKMNKRKTMLYLAVLNSFIVAIILLFTELSSNFILKLVIAFVLIFALMIPSYKFLGNYYRKKGLVKNV